MLKIQHFSHLRRIVQVVYWLTDNCMVLTYMLNERKALNQAQEKYSAFLPKHAPLKGEYLNKYHNHKHNVSSYKSKFFKLKKYRAKTNITGLYSDLNLRTHVTIHVKSP